MTQQEKIKMARDKAYTAWCNGDTMAFVNMAKSFGYKGGSMMRFIRDQRAMARSQANKKLNARK